MKGRRYWLVPSDHDPRNVFFARISGPLACLQIACFFVGAIGAPLGGGAMTPMGFGTFVGVTLVLFLIGYRGVVSGHEQRLGSVLPR